MAAEQCKGYVYRSMTPLTEEAMSGLLKGHFEGECAIVRRIDQAEVVRYTADEPLIENWTEGQIFNEAAELRWRKTMKGFAALWLTEQAASPEGFTLLKDSPFAAVCPSEKVNHGFLLWGTRLDEDLGRWWEARIPRTLYYPGFPINKNSGPPQLSYRLYREGETVRWIRLVKLVEVKNE